MIQKEILENLFDAGCSKEEIDRIITCMQTGDMQKALRQIDLCRENALEQMHQCQDCISRLDYLQYRLRKE